MTSFFLAEKPKSKKRFLHRLDPRVKLISFFVLILAVVFTPSHHYLKFMVYFFMLLFMIILDRIPIKDLGKRLFFIFPLLVFLASSLILFGKNQHSGDLDILWNILIKSLLSYLSLAVLSLTTEFYHLVKGLELLKLPRIIPSILSFAYRYNFLFVREAERLNRAKESRSFGKRKKLGEIKILSQLVPHLFFRTYARSERIYAAMLSRGYEGKIKTLSFFKPGKKDFLFIFLFSFLLVITLILL